MVPFGPGSLFSIRHGIPFSRIVAYTAPPIPDTNLGGAVPFFPFAGASAVKGRSPAAGRTDRSIAGASADCEGR